LNKEYALLCCIGQTWQTTTAATLELSPNGQTGTLVTHQQNPKQNLVYEFDSANQPEDFAFNGVWDVPIGHSRRYFNGVTGVADKFVSGWRVDWILTYISGNPVSLPGAENYCGQYSTYAVTSGPFQPTGALLPQSKLIGSTITRSVTRRSRWIPSITLFRRASRAMWNNPPPLSCPWPSRRPRHSPNYNLTFRAEAFNALNTPILGNVQSTTFTSPVFGVIPQSQNNFPRNIQLALMLSF
jgi:hypothetical protein